MTSDEQMARRRAYRDGFYAGACFGSLAQRDLTERDLGEWLNAVHQWRQRDPKLGVPITEGQPSYQQFNTREQAKG